MLRVIITTCQAIKKIIVEKKKQNSFETKSKKPTTGIFASAYISHGKSPKNDSYEYMILIDPNKEQLNNIEKNIIGYEVVLNSKEAHIVKDLATNTIGYAIFESLNSDDDDYVLQSYSELMVMLRPDGEVLNMSICNPDLNLGEYTYTTSTSSQPIINKVLLRGIYYLSTPNSEIEINHKDNNTEILSKLQDGKPINFTLTKSY